MAKRNNVAPQEHIDVEALHQSIGDLEALTTHPGWQHVGHIAQARFGVKATIDRIAQAVHSGVVGAELGTYVVEVIAARDAAIELLNAPSELIAKAKERLARAGKQEARAAHGDRPFGPDTEAST